MKTIVSIQQGRIWLAVLLVLIPCSVIAQSKLDTEDGLKLLQKLDDRGKAWMSKQPLAINFRYEYGSVMGESVEPIQTQHQKHVEVVFFPSGAITERTWALDEKGQRKSKLPELEVQYNGQGVASLRASQGRIRLSYHPEPTPSDAIGIRADSILVPLGKSSWYSMNTLSMFQLATLGTVSCSGKDETLTVDSKGEAGEFECQLDPKRRLKQVTITVDQPEHLHHGRTMKVTAYESISECYLGFEYVEPSDANVMGVKSWRIESQARLKSGANRRLSGKLEVLSAKLIDQQVPDFHKKLSFLNPIPNGTPVGVIANQDVTFEVRNNRICPVADDEVPERIETP